MNIKIISKYENYFKLYTILENNFYKFSFQFYCVIAVWKYHVGVFIIAKVNNVWNG